MQPTLIFRVHTDLRLGLGHVARALVLEALWRSQGGCALLAVSGGDAARRMGAGLDPFTGMALPCEAVDLGEDLHAPLPEAWKARAQAVLLDHWDTTPEEIQALRPLKVAVMEDDGDAHEGADLLFQPYLEGVKWPTAPVKVVGDRKVHPCETRHGACRVLRGGGYAVLSPLAVQQRPRREPEQPLAVHRLLVTFGGTDGPGLASRAFGILRDLVRSGAWMGACTIAAPRGLEAPPFPGCTVVERIPELTRRIRDYDALWCAAGLTLSEALCMGVPVAAWGQNERQHDIIADLALHDGCLDLGLGPEADPALTGASLAQWLGPEGQEPRQEQVRDGMALLDGTGAARVLRELLDLAREPAVRR
jgi:spore coat polysaccharide biosynthesis predicted glycosyltransferase SpsG